MTSLDPEIFEDTFHGCAFAAYLELAFACQGIPDCEAARIRAYELYELALAEKNKAR